MEVQNYIDVDGHAHGTVANELQEAFSAKSLRKFDSLPVDAVEIVDRAVIETAPLEMVGIPDLQTGIDERLVTSIDGLSAVYYRKQGAVATASAKIAMSPAVRKDHAGMRFYSWDYPLPVIYENYWLNKREMMQSRRVGYDKLATLAREATRSISRKAEDLLFNGEVQLEGKYIYGYTKYPDRQLYSITDWLTETGENIVEQCNQMLQRQIDARHYGPCVLYIPPSFVEVLRRDYIPSVVSDTVLSRIYAINTVPSGAGGRLPTSQMATIVAVKMAPYLSDGNVVLVEMRSNTVSLIEGLPLQNVQLPQNPNDLWQERYAVVAMWVPALMAQELIDGTKLCGIVHGSVVAPVTKKTKV